MADRRTSRHHATRQEILDAAWILARQRGLTGWSLRDLGDSVGMKAPSLYVYFRAKDEIYDAMFEAGYRELLASATAIAALEIDPVARLRAHAHNFFDFAVGDPARMQLMFQRVIPGFTPSETSYTVSLDALRVGAMGLAEAGADDPAALDVWTALLIGLANQQVSNDPGGDRWKRLVDRAVDAFIAHEIAPPGVVGPTLARSTPTTRRPSQ